jgi:hypothetical protein
MNGHEKWPMDSHTRRMFAQIGGTLSGGEHAVDDHGSFAATGKKMRAEIDELIRGCTMQGAAHDQLHNYLMAYIPAVDRMAEVGTKVQADSVRMLLDLYPSYFE